MPRKKREWYEGACYHVMGRGNRHCAIYTYALSSNLSAKYPEMVSTSRKPPIP